MLAFPVARHTQRFGIAARLLPSEPLGGISCAILNYRLAAGKTLGYRNKVSKHVPALDEDTGN
jgi:hypothetical protein